jgi:hypothetical protein
MYSIPMYTHTNKHTHPNTPSPHTLQCVGELSEGKQYKEVYNGEVDSVDLDSKDNRRAREGQTIARRKWRGGICRRWILETWIK